MEALKTDKSRRGVRPSPFWNDEVVIRSQRVRTVGFGSVRPVNPFEGLEAHSICCDSCGYVSSVRFTDFLNLNLYVPPVRRTTLADCLKHYTQIELVEDYICGGCTKKAGGIPMGVTIRKRSLIGQLPQAICFHLQIAMAGFDDAFAAFKTSTFVEFPEVLDLAPYTVNAHAASFFGTKHEGAAAKVSTSGGGSRYQPAPTRLSSPVVGGGGHEPPLSPDSFMERSVSPGFPKEEPYQIRAAIVHHGAGVGAGHFTCYRKFEHQWVSISDEKVQAVPAAVVFSAQAYMLFYERMTKK